VARTGERFGVNHLIDVLRGKETDKMWQFEHHLLPTFGVGTALDNNQWRSVFRQLVGRSYLSVDMEGYGALKLQEQCRPLLRGEVSIALRVDQKQKVVKRQTKTPLPEEVDVGLWEALRECRREQAEEQGVPPYVIFHDSTLIEMCTLLPQTHDEFANLTGVGERKLLKYGDAFLVAIRRAQDEAAT
jgi:ATP-dependent DNA helicase RecQ